MPNIEADDASLRRLFNLLEEWKSLTVQEARSIAARDWNNQEKLQLRKRQLQPQIKEARLLSFRPGASSAAQLGTRQRRLDAVIDELIALEEKNRKSIAERLGETQAKLRAADRNIRNLNHVRGAYGAKGPGYWQSYS